MVRGGAGFTLIPADGLKDPGRFIERYRVGINAPQHEHTRAHVQYVRPLGLQVCALRCITTGIGNE
jgi:hypothetical protein